MNGSGNTPALPDQLEKLEKRIVRAKLRDLKLLEKNARYMTPQEFAQRSKITQL